MAAALQKAGLVSKEQAKAVESEFDSKERQRAEQSVQQATSKRPAKREQDAAQEG